MKIQKNTEENLLKAIKKRLEVIICLLLSSKQPDLEEVSLREKIRLLHSFGFKPKEISEILQRSNIYINKELFEIRKPKRSRKQYERK